MTEVDLEAFIAIPPQGVDEAEVQQLVDWLMENDVSFDKTIVDSIKSLNIFLDGDFHTLSEARKAIERYTAVRHRRLERDLLALEANGYTFKRPHPFFSQQAKCSQCSRWATWQRKAGDETELLCPKHTLQRPDFDQRDTVSDVAWVPLCRPSLASTPDMDRFRNPKDAPSLVDFNWPH